jgi:hypothetical protein
MMEPLLAKIDANQESPEAKLKTNQEKMEAGVDANNEKFGGLRAIVVSRMGIHQGKWLHHISGG